MTLGSLESHIRDWQEMASFDPFGAILGTNLGNQRRWKTEEFLATAKPHMDHLSSIARSLGVPVQFNRALEFGCGAGRFLAHFEQQFGEVWGLDASEQMLDLAARSNPRCKLHLSTSPDLRFFNDCHFDLVYSFVVLQHLPVASVAEEYIKEFIRVLKPGGLLAFQVPDRLSIGWRVLPRRHVYYLMRRLGFKAGWLQSRKILPISMLAVDRERIAAIVAAAGGRVCREDDGAGNEGIFYYCIKRVSNS